MNILNTEMVYENELAQIFFVILCFASALGILISVIEISTSSSKRSGMLSLAVVSALFLVLSCFALSDMRKVNQYEVTLDANYTIDATKYKIIDQRGEIYVIKEIYNNRKGDSNEN